MSWMTRMPGKLVLSFVLLVGLTSIGFGPVMAGTFGEDTPFASCQPCSGDLDCCWNKYLAALADCMARFGENGAMPDAGTLADCRQEAGRQRADCNSMVDPVRGDCEQFPRKPGEDPDDIHQG